MRFEKFTCKHCNFSTYSIIKFIKHCKKEHNIKHLTAKDWRFVFKWHIITQVLMVGLRLPLVLLSFFVWCICYPFWFVKEFIENFYEKY